MKKILLISLSFLVFLSSVAFAEYYKVNIKKIDKDLYKDTISGTYIKTKYCYEYPYGEDAILKYEDYSYDNKLIFENGNTCDVVKIFK